jgi:hypothetical protein
VGPAVEKVAKPISGETVMQREGLGGGLAITKGGLYGVRHGARPVTIETTSYALDREMQDAFVRLTDARGVVPSLGISNARLGRQWPWRVLVRRLNEAIDAGVALERILGVLDVLSGYVRTRYRQRHPYRGSERRSGMDRRAHPRAA